MELRTRPRRARGLTLIEVMVALLVTTIALLGALATVGVTVRGANFSRMATEASVLVQSKLEQMVSYTASTVTASTPVDGTTITEPCLDANGTAPAVSCTAGQLAAYPYQRVTVWGTTTAPDAGRRTLTTTVSWTDANGNPHSVVATRLKDPK